VCSEAELVIFKRDLSTGIDVVKKDRHNRLQKRVLYSEDQGVTICCAERFGGAKQGKQFPVNEISDVRWLDGYDESNTIEIIHPSRKLELGLATRAQLDELLGRLRGLFMLQQQQSWTGVGRMAELARVLEEYFTKWNPKKISNIGWILSEEGYAGRLEDLQKALGDKYGEPPIFDLGEDEEKEAGVEPLKARASFGELTDWMADKFEKEGGEAESSGGGDGGGGGSGGGSGGCSGADGADGAGKVLSVEEQALEMTKATAAEMEKELLRHEKNKSRSAGLNQAPKRNSFASQMQGWRQKAQVALAEGKVKAQKAQAVLASGAMAAIQKVEERVEKLQEKSKQAAADGTEATPVETPEINSEYKGNLPPPPADVMMAEAVHTAGWVSESKEDQAGGAGGADGSAAGGASAALANGLFKGLLDKHGQLRKPEAGELLTVNVRNIQAVMAGTKWAFQQDYFPHMHGEGLASAAVKDVGVTISFKLERVRIPAGQSIVVSDAVDEPAEEEAAGADGAAAAEGGAGDVGGGGGAGGDIAAKTFDTPKKPGKSKKGQKSLEDDPATVLFSPPPPLRVSAVGSAAQPAVVHAMENRRPILASLRGSSKVAPRDHFRLALRIRAPDCTVRWKFLTEEFDISFGLHLWTPPVLSPVAKGPAVPGLSKHSDAHKNRRQSFSAETAEIGVGIARLVDPVRQPGGLVSASGGGGKGAAVAAGKVAGGKDGAVSLPTAHPVHEEVWVSSSAEDGVLEEIIPYERVDSCNEKVVGSVKLAEGIYVLDWSNEYSKVRGKKLLWDVAVLGPEEEEDGGDTGGGDKEGGEESGGNPFSAAGKGATAKPLSEPHGGGGGTGDVKRTPGEPLDSKGAKGGMPKGGKEGGGKEEGGAGGGEDDEESDACTERLRLVLQSSEISIGELSLAFEGSWFSWAYNALATLLQNMIRDAVSGGYGLHTNRARIPHTSTR
jgi:hypothetical protein